MIYLIDEKDDRQRDYGWSDERFDSFEDCIMPIRSFDELTSDLKNRLFSDGNTLLLHESFFNNLENDFESYPDEVANRINGYVEGKENWSVVFFSGSKNTRRLEGRSGHIPVADLYQNLEVFLEKEREGKTDLRHLFFGRNSTVEERLLHNLEESNLSFNDEDSGRSQTHERIFIGRAFKQPIDKFVDGPRYERFFLDARFENDVTDEYMHSKIFEWFNEEGYDKIFVPLCFGPTLSDYNGLRFALHLRCTDTPNRLSPIFLYSYVGHKDLMDSEYFDILKTKNVFLIPYKRSAFEEALSVRVVNLTTEQLPAEIDKILLHPPKDYEDEHSIANEWAIYRWASTLNHLEADEIKEVIRNVKAKIYFKYLQSKNVSQASQSFSDADLKIKFSSRPRILYVDDEAEKGWYEVFFKIFYEANGLVFDHLDQEMNGLSQEEIIQLVRKQVIEYDIDVVLLDFRLHKRDFLYENPHEITGYKVLKAIKEINPGIQVIVFSATNKVWNYQALKLAGADAFVIKESPNQSSGTSLTGQSIKATLQAFEKAFGRVFIKDFFKRIAEIRNNLLECDTEDDTEFDAFITDSLQQLSIIENSAKYLDTEDLSSFDIFFLNCYNFCELYKAHYIWEESYQFLMGIDGAELKRYAFSKGKLSNQGHFVRNSHYDKPSWFQAMVGLLSDYFNGSWSDLDFKEINSIKNARNKFIHEEKTHFTKKELQMILDLCYKLTSSVRE